MMPQEVSQSNEILTTEKPIIPRDVSQSDRVLTEEQQKKLENDKVISTFKKDKLEREAQKNWDLFYKRNTINFFKDRNWLDKEFEELSSDYISKKSPIVLLEVGCGCGNTIFPIIESNPTGLFVYACDFSKRAVEFVKSDSHFNNDICKVFQCDLTTDDILDNVPRHSVDIVTMFFVLSAITPEKMSYVLKNIAKVLKKDGGVLLFRDYGLYDHAMLRFSSGQKIDENFYVRQDGTRAYYFSLDFMKKLVIDAGFAVIENQYILKRTVNKKENIDVPRIFIQGRFTLIEDT